jgi:Viral BACON domain
VVFVGYDTDTDVAVRRKDRFYAAEPSPGSLPHIMVDSGQQVSWGINFPDLDVEYHRLIDAELGRDPQAAITAEYKRVSNHFEITAKVTNQSGTTLLTSTNKARVHAVVYETFTNATRPADALVNNVGRATYWSSITKALANGATDSYTIVTPEMSAVNWDNLHVLVMVDYVPGGGTGPYDMLQAAFAQPNAAYTIAPTSLTFLVNSKAPADKTSPVRINSASTTMNWSAAADASWLSVSPATAKAGTPALVKVTAGGLAAGTQNGSITFTITDVGGYSRTENVPVTAYLGVIREINLPYIRR